MPYYIAFEDELTKYFEGIITDDYQTFAPKVDINRKLMRSPTTLTNRSKLDPETGVPLLYFGPGHVPEFRGLDSLRFADRQMVFRVGTGEEVTPGAGKEPPTCEDPLGGHIYGTIRDPALPATDTAQGGAVATIMQCRAQVDAYVNAAAANQA